MKSWKFLLLSLLVCSTTGSFAYHEVPVVNGQYLNNEAREKRVQALLAFLKDFKEDKADTFLKENFDPTLYSSYPLETHIDLLKRFSGSVRNNKLDKIMHEKNSSKIYFQMPDGTKAAMTVSFNGENKISGVEMGN